MVCSRRVKLSDHYIEHLRMQALFICGFDDMVALLLKIACNFLEAKLQSNGQYLLDISIYNIK